MLQQQIHNILNIPQKQQYLTNTSSTHNTNPKFASPPPSPTITQLNQGQSRPITSSSIMIRLANFNPFLIFCKVNLSSNNWLGQQPHDQGTRNAMKYAPLCCNNLCNNFKTCLHMPNEQLPIRVKNFSFLSNMGCHIHPPMKTWHCHHGS